jgi:hypothetical protein
LYNRQSQASAALKGFVDIFDKLNMTTTLIAKTSTLMAFTTTLMAFTTTLVLILLEVIVIKASYKSFFLL